MLRPIISLREFVSSYGKRKADPGSEQLQATIRLAREKLDELEKSIEAKQGAMEGLLKVCDDMGAHMKSLNADLLQSHAAQDALAKQVIVLARERDAYAKQVTKSMEETLEYKRMLQESDEAYCDVGRFNDVLRQELGEAKKEIKRLAGGIIREAAENGRITVAPTTIVDYLEPEIRAEMMSRGLDFVFLSDESCLSDFGIEDKRYIWQVILDKWRAESRARAASGEQI